MIIAGSVRYQRFPEMGVLQERGISCARHIPYHVLITPFLNLVYSSVSSSRWYISKIISMSFFHAFREDEQVGVLELRGDGMISLSTGTSNPVLQNLDKSLSLVS